MYPQPQPVIDFFDDVGLKRENLGLALDKFIDWFEDKRGNYTPNKRDYFAQATRLFKQAPSPDTTEMVQALARRWQATLGRSPFPVRSFTAETLWYFTTGKGSSDLVGSLLFLHQNFAVPIVRGSTLRGTAHVYARDYLLPEAQITEEEIKHLFGNSPEEEEHNQGALTFFDAFPLSADCLKVTATTCQNDGYYSGNEQLMIKNNVIPLYHLCVPADVPFLFAIGSADDQALEIGEKILRKSLRKSGAGAKIHVGYGYFRIPENEPPASAP
jgi:CRISPR type III-B/RAMP module RAMP protein Cmr6